MIDNDNKNDTFSHSLFYNRCSRLILPSSTMMISTVTADDNVERLSHNTSTINSSSSINNDTEMEGGHWCIVTDKKKKRRKRRRRRGRIISGDESGGGGGGGGRGRQHSFDADDDKSPTPAACQKTVESRVAPLFSESSQSTRICSSDTCGSSLSRENMTAPWYNNGTTNNGDSEKIDNISHLNNLNHLTRKEEEEHTMSMTSKEICVSTMEDDDEGDDVSDGTMDVWEEATMATAAEAMLEGLFLIGSCSGAVEQVTFSSKSKALALEEQEDALESNLITVITSQEPNGPHRRTLPPPLRTFIHQRVETCQTFEKSHYITKRTMTPLQERMNALTVLPGAAFCIYFLLSGRWWSDNINNSTIASNDSSFLTGNYNDPMSSIVSNCLSTPLLPHLPALPPAPLLIITCGIMAHAPFSFLYHWHYCTTLPPGLPRLEHWSRRMDQAFIHVISASLSYGTSGRWDYFFANVVFNLHCMIKMFGPTATPRKAQMRIGASIVAYTLPVLRQGDITTFIGMWIVIGLSAWFFSAYPIGGWSHSAFHIVISLLPPICLHHACGLTVSQGQIVKAIMCASSSSSSSMNDVIMQHGLSFQ